MHTTRTHPPVGRSCRPSRRPTRSTCRAIPRSPPRASPSARARARARTMPPNARRRQRAPLQQHAAAQLASPCSDLLRLPPNLASNDRIPSHLRFRHPAPPPRRPLARHIAPSHVRATPTSETSKARAEERERDGALRARDEERPPHCTHASAVGGAPAREERARSRLRSAVARTQSCDRGARPPTDSARVSIGRRR